MSSFPTYLNPKNTLKVFVTLLLTFSCFYGAFSQKDTRIRKIVYQAYDLYSQQRYHEAKGKFYSLLEYNPNNFNYNYGMALCLYYQRSDSAALFFERCLRLQDAKPDILYYYLGKTQQQINKFDEAIVYYNKFLERLPKSYDFDYYEKRKYKYEVYENIVRCRNGLHQEHFYTGLKPTNLGAEVNSEHPEYAPLVNYDENRLFYTAAKPDSRSTKYQKQYNSYSEDIYYANWSEKKEQWFGDNRLQENKKKNRSQSVLFMSLDGQDIVFHNSHDENSKLKIYKKNLRKGRFEEAQKFAKKLNNKYRIKNFFIAQDGMVIIFSSDKQGGYGGTDLYIMRRDAQGQWSPPANMGPMINTPYNEDMPCLLPDNVTLLYCSNNLLSVGGYDIFVTRSRTFGDWEPPKNLGLAVNTGGDDLFPSVGHQSQSLYFSSYRMGGYGQEDIYKVALDSVISQYVPCTVSNKTDHNLNTELQFDNTPHGLHRRLEPNQSFTYFLPKDEEINFTVSHIGQAYKVDQFIINRENCRSVLKIGEPSPDPNP